MNRIIIWVLLGFVMWATGYPIAQSHKTKAKTSTQESSSKKKGLKVKATAHAATLSWTNSPVPAPGTLNNNKVYRFNGACPVPFNGTVINVSSAPISTFTDTTVAAANQYCYAVTETAICASCTPGVLESGFSNAVVVNVPGDVLVAPNPPTGLTGTAQ